MKITIPFNNFALGKIDHDLMGRFDLPVYQSGADVVQNFFTNFKGNAIYRTGFEDMLGEAFQDCVFQEFKFRNDQNYLMLFYNTKIRFMSYDASGNFGWVLDGSSNILEVTTPYSLSECRELVFAQNADVMVITHQNYPPKALTRTAANAFTFTDYAFTDAGGSPFAAKTATITGATKANPCVITSANHNLRSGDIVTITGVVGMTQLNGNSYVVTMLTSSTFSLNSVNSTAYGTYTSGGSAAKTASYPKCCLFYKGRLYFANTPNKATTVWASASALYNSFDLPATVTDASPLQFTVAEITQPIEWLFGGDNSLIAGSADGVVAINGGSVGQAIKADSIEANLTSADGCNASIPFKKDGLIFYAGQNNRNVYYFNYDLLTESFIAKDANVLSYDITLGGLSKIRWKKDRNDLIYCVRGDGNLLSLNFNMSEKITGWHVNETQGLFKDIAVITDNDGNPQLFSLVYRFGAYYIERMASHVQFAERVQFFSWGEQELSVTALIRDRDAYSRYVAEQMRRCIYLDSALQFSDLQDNLITYDANLNKITATNNVFYSGDVGKHIAYKTVTGYETGRFMIDAYIDAKNVTVSVLQEPSQTTSQEWYRSFGSVSGLAKFNGTEVGIVTDGGFLTTSEVYGGTLSFDNQVLSAVVGYTYTGVIKSFCLGMQIQAENTQATIKGINGFTVRAVSSAGGKVGSSLYALERVQELSQNDLNYLPPIVIDGSKYVSYVDDGEKDKYFYIVQDEPLPFIVTCVMIDAKYAIR